MVIIFEYKNFLIIINLMDSNNQKNQNNLLFQNQMNNQMYNNGMIQNQMYNGMMSNQINTQMYNEIMPNQMNNQMFNGISSDQKNNQIYNGMMTNQIINKLYNGMEQNQMNNIMMENQNSLITNIQNPINSSKINNNDDINNMKNIPIENSIELELDNDEPIKLYLYPEIDLTEEELNNSKVLLIIGQTGHGKTTFINALVNIYLGITIKDEFRYLLVQNENINQLNSITKEITIYKIRSKKGLNFPPLIIIDTPGFGDTEGEKADKKNLEKFREFFGSKKINNINCILYIIIGANSRFGEKDKNIINYLLNLFSKNVKDNFVVGVTNFIPESKRDIPNIIKSLSDENHFYYQNVLKNDKLSRKEIINSNWYFTSDNKIISNNEIEGNEKEKEKWQYTEKQIKNFIENKIKILEKKNIQESYNVLNSRFQLENEINSFTEKIDVLIPKKIVYESNLEEQKKYKEKIIEIKEEINNNNLEKKIINQYLKEINNALPYMKKIISNPFESNNYNLICEECQLNCHKNCNCILTIFSNWCCDMISFNGNCKICNHSVSMHKKEKLIYIQKEVNEPLINNEIEELQNYIKFLSIKKEEEALKMNEINEANDLFKKTLNILNKQLINCNEEIEKIKNSNLSVEIEITIALKNIKNNLDFLRKNALNKETRTINNFIEEYIKNKNDNEKKIIINLYKNYIFLDTKNILKK